MISKQTLQQIADLQIKICTIDERLCFLRDCIRQLLYDNCDISLSFKMINRDIQQKNDSASSSQGEECYTGIVAMLGFAPELISIKKPKQEPDKTEFFTSFTETNAVLVLNVFYEQELTLQKKYQAQLQELLFQSNDNPILQRHLSNQ